ncbi:polymer-forming cytoskeletal protein [Massilia jejuensis]|uniref:Polymer-forming cytoskeletal protein n=1 Tax=Massilia jejuensis TaxID=648894 RepID=A0ABW0PEG8_9BURK
MNDGHSNSNFGLGDMPSLDTPHTSANRPAPGAGAGLPPSPRGNNFNPGADPKESSFAEYVAKGATADVLVDALEVSMAIGSDDVIEGKIRIGGKKSLVIRGTVLGSVECAGRVVILSGGSVKGHIRAAALWVEGDVGETGKPSTVEVGDLHLGVQSRVIGDCTYDTLSVATPNRGIRGQLIPRSEADNG